MSSEVCPFCGKTYKRLKSHLPHCKAAASDKAPPAKREAKAPQTSSRLAGPAAEAGESARSPSARASPPLKKGEKVPAVSTAAPKRSEQASSSSSSSRPSSQSAATPPPATKRKKQKLSEQIETNNAAAAVSKPKKKSPRASIDAAKSDEGSKGTAEEPASASGGVASTPDPQTPPSAGAKPKGASKRSAPKTKRAAPDLPTAEDAAVSPDSGLNETRAKPQRGGEKYSEDGEEEFENQSLNGMMLKSRGGHQAGITLSDVKAALGRRPNGARRPSSVLSQIVTAGDEASSRVGAGPRPSPASVPMWSQGASPTPPLPPAAPPSRVSDVRPPPQTVGTTTAAAAGHPAMSATLTRISSHRLFPHGPRAVRVEILRADGGPAAGASPKQSASDDGSEGRRLTERRAAVTQRSLGQVRLEELPEWLACKAPRRPGDVVKMVQGGWQWYYKKYIEVRRGGLGGLSMIIAGYCVLSYIWSYPLIKHDRRRKYH